MKLIIGLGNPGKEFENTAHNVGAWVVEQFASSQKLNEFSLDKKMKALISVNEGLFVALPQTYMNESGLAVAKIVDYYKIWPENLLIVHDDSDLMLERYKLQFNRGSAGHRGIESIVKILGTKKFWRLRVGIRPMKENARRLAGDFVLKKLSKKDKEKIETLLPDITKDIYGWLGNT